MNQSVVTIAAGNPYYLNLAWNLARSFRCWHSHSQIKFCIITDLPQDDWPLDLHWVHVQNLAKGDLGVGFSSKLQLDQLAPADKSLFLDADCLICGPLEPVFKRFQGKAVGVVGGSIREGDWFGDIAQLRTQLILGPLPKFNGGLYYLEPGDTCSRVYSRARALEPLYDELGLVRLRNRPNDELLMAIALAEAGLSALPDDGSILGDPQACQVGLRINVPAGRSHLTNPPAGHRLHQAWYPVGTIRPLVVHFLAHHTDQHPYRTQAIQLRLMQRFFCSPQLARLLAEIHFGLLARLQLFSKRIFRPIYRRFFGFRAIKTSIRNVA